MLSLSRPLSRRSVQGMLAVALVAPASGCDLLSESTPVTPDPPTADEALVERVTARIRDVRDVAASVLGAGSLVDVHDAHLAALGSPAPTSSPSSSPSPTASPTPTRPAVAGLVAGERSLETTLTDAAIRAEDGGLARLLASMAAAVAQQIALLPARKVPR